MCRGSVGPPPVEKCHHFLQSGWLDSDSEFQRTSRSIQAQGVQGARSQFFFSWAEFLFQAGHICGRTQRLHFIAASLSLVGMQTAYAPVKTVAQCTFSISKKMHVPGRVWIFSSGQVLFMTGLVEDKVAFRGSGILNCFGMSEVPELAPGANAHYTLFFYIMDHSAPFASGCTSAPISLTPSWIHFP